jgi:TadE-like protein
MTGLAANPTDEPRDPRHSERGVATVEAILVVPLVLVPILFGVVIFGRIEHAKLVLDAAAAAGARQAAVIGGDGPSVRSRIATELRGGGVDPGNVRVSVSPASVGWGAPIAVRLDAGERAALPFLGTWSVPLSSVFVTRGEVTH